MEKNGAQIRKTEPPAFTGETRRHQISWRIVSLSQRPLFGRDVELIKDRISIAKHRDWRETTAVPVEVNKINLSQSNLDVAWFAITEAWATMKKKKWPPLAMVAADQTKINQPHNPATASDEDWSILLCKGLKI